MTRKSRSDGLMRLQVGQRFRATGTRAKEAQAAPARRTTTDTEEDWLYNDVELALARQMYLRPSVILWCFWMLVDKKLHEKVLVVLENK